MSNEVSALKKQLLNLQKSHDDLMAKYKNALLDITKAKLDAQEERIKFKEKLFFMKQKVSALESEFVEHQKNTPLSRSDYDELLKKDKELSDEIANLEKELNEP